VGQFAASVVLILATGIVYQQMEFVRAERLNAQGEEMLVVSNRSEALDGRYAAFKEQLRAAPSVAQVTTGQVPGRIRYRTSTHIDTTGQFGMLGLLWVGDDYLTTLGLDVVAGQSFDDAAAARPHLRNVALINETAARLAGYTADSLGQPNSPFNSSTVIGIVADYHATSLFEPIMPLVLLHTTRVQDQVVVRLRRGQVAEGLTAVQAAWDAFVPDRPVQYTFLDQELDKMYRAEVRLGQLFGVFAAVAILLAGVGLLGLSAYVARRRAKEVSIRKVLGATAQQVIALLSREFVVLVAVAFGIGAPVAYLAMQRWLADFAYRIEVGAGLFVGVGAVVLLVTLLIVGSQAWRTARTDPAEVLRSE
jgi:putative ABC transport system permease protein